MKIIAWPARKWERTNPYTALLYAGLERAGVRVDECTVPRLLAGKYSVWHIHWPEYALTGPTRLYARARGRALLGLMDLVRRRGTRVVWTVHNLKPHDHFSGRSDPAFWDAFTSRLDAYISLTEMGKGLAEERFPALRALPGFVIPIGHFRDSYPNTVTRAEARERLGLKSDARVLLFLGFIRPYKNVVRLVEEFTRLPGDDLVLLVAGQPYAPELGHEIRRAAARDPRVRVSLEFVEHDRLQVLFAAADLVVLPYREILNSAAALLALSFDRPLLVPELGAMAELRARVGGAWVRAYTGELTPGVLDSALEWALGCERPDRAPLEALSWSDLSRRTAEAYRRITAR
jgi:beta-1,4-mannosyltransferase